MDVLVVNGSRVERKSLGRMLQQARLRAELVEDTRGAAFVFERECPPVVVVDWDAEAPGLVKRLRAKVARRPYVIALLDRPRAADVDSLYAAGVDDFLFRPIVATELVGRVGAPRRIAGWASAPQIHDWSGSVDIARSGMFQQLGSIVRDVLSQMIGDTLEVVEGWSGRLAGLARGATIPLTVLNEETELRVTVRADTITLESLGVALLGERAAPEPLLDDMLRELANTAAGAAKRAALIENIALSTGLPMDDCGCRLSEATSRRWVMMPAHGMLRIGLVAEVGKRRSQPVPAAHLREGMVVASDLRSGAGVLLAAAGTRLTQTSASKLAAILGAKVVVEIARAA